MTVEVNVSGRFKVLDQPYSLPSKCAFCSLGHNQDGKVTFIDTTLDLDFYGVVYICSNCLTEISNSLGYISPAAWEKIVKDSTDNLIENERLKAENDVLRSTVTGLTIHRCNRDITSYTLHEDAPGPEVNEPAGEPPKGIEPAEPKSDSSSSEPGLSDVRGTAKLKPKSSKSGNDPLAEFDV